MELDFVPFALPDFDEREIEAVTAVLRSGWVTTGPRVQEFEAEFSSYVGASHGVAVNSCTAALHLALEAFGVGPGDEVVTTPYTFAATASTIEHLGARPVFVDVEPDTLNVDPDLARLAVTKRTKAIVPVHFAGHACDLDRLYAMASANGLAVVEDCAHALPARIGGRLIGADVDRSAYPGLRGHATCFSFYATKTLSTGEGGMLCTGWQKVADRARLMALHGMTRDAWKRYTEAGSWFYEIEAPGFKYNMTDIAAALGVVQLTKVERMWRRRAEIADAYTEAFSAYPEIRTPACRPGIQHAWHVYALRLELEDFAIDRAAFIERLKKAGVGASVHFIPLHLHPYYRGRYGYMPHDFPVALEAYQREVSLPIYSRMTDVEVRHVTDAVTRVVREDRVR